MRRGIGSWIFGLFLLAATGLGFGIPSGVLADTSSTAGPPANVSFSPGITSVTVGEFVTEVATVTDSEGNLVADGTPGAWSITVPGSTPANITRIDTMIKNGQFTLIFSTTTVGVAQIKFTAGYEPNTASGSTSVTWIAGSPARVTLSTGNTNASIGDAVSECATVTDRYGNLVADGTSVTFQVSGSNSASATATTVNGQVSFHYSAAMPGTDTLTVTAGSAPQASASITWAVPTSTKRAALNILARFSPSIVATVRTGANGGIPTGLLSYTSSAVRLSQVELTSLVVNGSQATLYGHARIADGTSVGFRLDATEGRKAGTLRLRLSNGYDSGNQSALVVRITP
jgi:hypothetical protein